jgi:hypothetical protein
MKTFPKIRGKQLARLRVDQAGGENMMTERNLREQEVQIARYRLLEREVTDPLAAGLLHIIILELEADLQEKIGELLREPRHQ